MTIQTGAWTVIVERCAMGWEQGNRQTVNLVLQHDMLGARGLLLTPAEAREVAALLVAEAALADEASR